LNYLGVASKVFKGFFSREVSERLIDDKIPWTLMVYPKGKKKSSLHTPFPSMILG
jgi:hypothetical protein